MSTNQSHEKLANRLLWVAGAMLVALGWVVAQSMVEPNVNVGDNAPGFRLTTDTGKTVTTTDFGGKVLVLNFWATWCQPCIEEIPSLNAMATQLAPKGVVVLGVSVDKNQQAYRGLLQRAGVKFETARDPEANIPAEYGTYKFPETYVISKDGKVLQKYIGPRDWTDPETLKSLEGLL